MRQHRAFALGVAGLAMAATVIVLLHQRTKRPQPSPITLRFLNRLGSNSCVFWVTNHTTNDLAIVVSSVQVRTGLVWTNYLIVHEALCFPTKIAPMPIPNLAALSVSTSIVNLPGLPAGSSWRVKALVTEKLYGVAAASKNMMEHRRLMEIRRATGDTNISINPFSQTVPVYGHSREVFSEEAAQ